jgi:hypothetical protein
METGKMFLVALISVVSTYAAVTAWPALKELASPLNGSAVAATIPAPTTIQPVAAVTTYSPTVPAIPAAQTSAQLQPSKQSLQTTRPLNTPRRSTIPWNYADVKYARRTVTLRKTPAGQGLKAQSLNLADLRILKGTRLMPVKQQGDWVMVQAPSAVIGWVPAKDLARTRPVSSDSFKLRATD